MGNDVNANIKSSRYYKKQKNENINKYILTPFSINDCFQIESSLFKSPTSSIIQLDSLSQIVNLEEKVIYSKFEPNIKTPIIYDNIENINKNSSLFVFRDNRILAKKDTFTLLEPNEYKFVNSFKLFQYRKIFKNVELDMDDKFIIKFTSHVSLLPNEFIEFFEKDFIEYLMKNRKINKSPLTFNKLIQIIKEDFTYNFKLFNYIQIYLNKINKNNCVEIVSKMLSEEGDLINLMNNPVDNLNIGMFYLLVLYIFDNNSNSKFKIDHDFLYLQINKNDIDINNLFVKGNYITNGKEILNTTKRLNYLLKNKQNIIEISLDRINMKYSYLAKNYFDISMFSNFTNEMEILIQPFSIFEVLSININDEDNTLYIKLRMHNNFFSDIAIKHSSKYYYDFNNFDDDNNNNFSNCNKDFAINMGTCTFYGEDLTSIFNENYLDNLIGLTFIKNSQIDNNKNYLGNCKNLLSIDLQNCKINDELLINLMPFIINFSFLKYLNLSKNNFTHKSMDYLSEGFKFLSYLEYLNLSNNNLNDLSIIKLCKNIIYLYNLISLNIENNKLSSKSIKEFCMQLANIHKLKRLNISNNNFDTEECIDVLVECFNQMLYLHDINLSNNNLNSQGLYKFSSKIINDNLIEYADFSNNNIKDNGLFSFASNLEKYKFIKKLNFYNNEIGGIGLSNFMENIHILHFLKEINFGKNLINDKSLSVISKNLSKFKQINNIFLNNNDITDKGFEEFVNNSTCLFNLKILDFSNNYLMSEDILFKFLSVIDKNLAFTFTFFNISLNKYTEDTLKKFILELKKIEPYWENYSSNSDDDGMYIKKSLVTNYDQIINLYVYPPNQNNNLLIKNEENEDNAQNNDDTNPPLGS